MGSVFEARTDAGERVAVKVITTNITDSRTLLARFEREARAAFTIRTPHICRALDMGTDAPTGMPYLVMELLDGEDVEHLQARLGPLPPELALRIAAQTCLGLREAHAAGVLHRDIKPANLFLAREAGGRVVKLLDFGVAKVGGPGNLGRSNAETAGLTRTGSMLGSPLYMSPEQARGLKDIDFRSDLWSLGVVLYKMLSGHAPHEDTRELGELIILICTEPAAPLQDVAPWISPRIAEIVHRALRFKPAERWPGAADMYAALHAILPEGDSIAESLLRPLGEAERAAAAPRLDADLRDSPPSRRRPVDSAKRPAAATQPPGGTGTGTLALEGPSPGPALPITPFSGQPSSAGQASAGQTSSGQTSSDPASPWAAGASGGAPSVPPSAGSAVPGGPNGTRRASVVPYIAVGAVLLLGGAVAAVALTTDLLSGSDLPPAAPSQSAPPPGQQPVTVTVTVAAPPGAIVEVDGAAASLENGTLRITGTIGSVHRVKVKHGGAEKNVRVVVAQTGAVPEKIELGSDSPAPPASQPK